MVPNDFHILQTFFNENGHKYDFEHKEECGKFTEDSLIYMRKVTGDLNYKHLRKYGSATQYNGHAIDVWAYDNRDDKQTGETNIMEIDILVSAETENALPSWQIRTTQYKPEDLMEPEGIGQPPVNQLKTVPWVIYNEQGFQRLKNMLMHDYARRPQQADFDVSVWAGRYFHNCYMGPDGKPLGEQAALERVKPELCAALGIPMDNYYG